MSLNPIYKTTTKLECPGEPECSIEPLSKHYKTCPTGTFCGYNGFKSTCIPPEVCGTAYIQNNKVIGTYECNPLPGSENDESKIPVPEPEDDIPVPIPKEDSVFDVED